MEEKLKRCSKCNTFKSYDCFYKSKHRKDGYANECKACNRERQKLWYSTDAGRQSALKRRKKYYYDNPTRVKETSRKTRIKNKEKLLFRSARYRAEQKNIDFDISIDDIIIPNVCPILGIPIYRDAKLNKDNSPSIDRIDNSKGYIKGNICVISYKANTLKSFGTIEEFYKIIEYMKNPPQK